VPQGEVFVVWLDWFSDTTIESVWDTESAAIKERDRLNEKPQWAGQTYVVSAFTLNVPDGHARTLEGGTDAAAR